MAPKPSSLNNHKISLASKRGFAFRNGFFIGFVFGLKVNKNNQTGQFSFSPA